MGTGFYRGNTATVFALLILVAGCGGGESSGSGEMPPAEQAFNAAAEFQAMTMAEDVSAEDWLALAQRAREAGDLDTAGNALDLAAANLSRLQLNLERARIEAAAGRNVGAVSILQQMADNGFLGVALITDDPVLGGLSGDPGFDALVEAMSRAAYPCRYDEGFRDFDFWLGEWEVHTASGQFAGTNSVRSEEAGCMVTEHWTSATGGSGSSINYLDKTTGEWVQVWNSENGAQISIRGGLTDEGMRLEGHLHYVANGTTLPFRGLWTPMEDGRVRQFFEQSTDDGESWAPWFEGFYTRRSEPATE